MAYLKINGVDFSMYVNQLKVSKEANYNAQTNAAGDTVVDFINAKRTIEVGIIPLDSAVAAQLLALLDNFSLEISFLNPITNRLEENVVCILPETEVDYYTIQAGNTKLNAFNLSFIEL
jgi:hypothetical protein